MDLLLLYLLLHMVIVSILRTNFRSSWKKLAEHGGNIHCQSYGNILEEIQGNPFAVSQISLRSLEIFHWLI